jgi:rubrerythrin
MPGIFHLREIIDFAVRIEQNGHRFYTDAMKKFQDKNIQELFQDLASEEMKHEATFRNLAMDLGSYSARESYPGEYEAYTSHFLKSHALGDSDLLEKKLASIQGIADAIAIALEFEKDSIAFFAGLKKFVGVKQEKLEEIIQEEVRHIIRISRYKK